MHKVPERSRWYVQYGPFMLSDARTHAITAAGMTFEQLAEQV